MDLPSWLRERLGVDNPQKDVGTGETRSRYMVVSRTAPQMVYLRVVGEGADDLHNEYPIVREGMMYDRYQKKWLGHLREDDSTVYKVVLEPVNEQKAVWLVVGWEKVGRLRRGESVYTPDP